MMQASRSAQQSLTHRWQKDSGWDVAFWPNSPQEQCTRPCHYEAQVDSRNRFVFLSYPGCKSIHRALQGTVMAVKISVQPIANKNQGLTIAVKSTQVADKFPSSVRKNTPRVQISFTSSTPNRALLLHFNNWHGVFIWPKLGQWLYDQ